MSARLRDVEDMLAQLHAEPAAARPTPWTPSASQAAPAIRLEAATYAAKLFIGSEPIGIPVCRSRSAGRARSVSPPW